MQPHWSADPTIAALTGQAGALAGQAGQQGAPAQVYGAAKQVGVREGACVSVVVCVGGGGGVREVRVC